MTKHRILIVEDDTTLNEAYKTLLTKAGYAVATALNGKEALALIKKSKFNLIFLDLRMPVMSGLEFLKKYSPKMRGETQIIIFSNYDMQSEIDEAYQLGAERYVLKAWASPRELLQIVEASLHPNQNSVI